jgi:hypothetical protein
MKAKWSLFVVVAVCAVFALQTGCDQETEVQRPTINAAEPKTVPPKTVPAKVPAKTVPASQPPSPDKPPRKIAPPGIGKIEPQPQKGTPKITFEKVVHDFGRVGPATSGRCEFAFRNTGDGPLEIGRIRTCCGVHADLKAGKKKYEPQEAGTIIVTFNMARFRGLIKKRLTVPSNDNANPRVQLTIKAEVAMQVRCEPSRLALSLREENAGCPQINLTSTDGRLFTVNSFSSTNNTITAAFDASLKAAEIVLEPRVDATKLKSGSRGQVKIGLTHPNCRAVTIDFAVPPRFSAEPAAIMVRNIKPGIPIKKEVQIFSNHDEDFEIESTRSKRGTIEVLSQQRLGKRHKFELQITPPARKGKTRVFSEAFIVNLKGGERVVINCRGTYSRG